MSFNIEINLTNSIDKIPKNVLERMMIEAHSREVLRAKQNSDTEQKPDTEKMVDEFAKLIIGRTFDEEIQFVALRGDEKEIARRKYEMKEAVYGFANLIISRVVNGKTLDEQIEDPEFGTFFVNEQEIQGRKAFCESELKRIKEDNSDEFFQFKTIAKISFRSLIKVNTSDLEHNVESRSSSAETNVRYTPRENTEKTVESIYEEIAKGLHTADIDKRITTIVDEALQALVYTMQSLLRSGNKLDFIRERADTNIKSEKYQAVCADVVSIARKLVEPMKMRSKLINNTQKSFDISKVDTKETLKMICEEIEKELNASNIDERVGQVVDTVLRKQILAAESNNKIQDANINEIVASKEYTELCKKTTSMIGDLVESIKAQKRNEQSLVNAPSVTESRRTQATKK